jgi:hypothetical protein
MPRDDRHLASSLATLGNSVIRIVIYSGGGGSAINEEPLWRMRP